ncbi:AAA family ATPase [Actinoplanes derwentensis]|uniref:Adenylate kinase n=1 Tax=Actinoplanes derwentensis TaxID=113562 RepID=A0A1H2DCW8_9ACTN|nr:hypothetical protein [Actinoplanes derwentensis]GID89977.1 adenylate kinase [Actinoplanes derwentensis]SDT80598.1 hypothetical protein SAMN04489716_9273 [Actinoplanes derwentensis]
MAERARRPGTRATSPGRLTERHARIAVAGASGAGKTTLAARLARAHGLERVELDSLYYGPGWTRRDDLAQVAEAALSGPRWVTEWQYDEVIPLLTERADLVIWLDYPCHVTATSVVLRSWLRRIHHEVLWAGNREGGMLSVLWNPHHALRYAVTSGGRRLRDSLAPVLTPGRAGPQIWRFRTPAQLSDWVRDALEPAGAEAPR